MIGVNYDFRELDSVDQDLVQQIINMEKVAFGEGGMNHWFIVPFIRHGRVFALVDREQIVAVAEYMRDFSQPTLAYLFGLAVKQEYQGQGLGYQLLVSAHSRLVRYGFTEVTLTADPHNQQALALYEQKMEFQRCRFLPNEYGLGIDRLYLRLQLSGF